MPKKKVAIIGLGEHQINGIKTANKYFETIGFDNKKNALGKSYVKKFYNINTNKVKEIYKICKKNKVIKALSFNSDAVLKTVYQINEKIDKQKFSQSKIILDKTKLRYFLKKSLFAIPKYYILKKKNEIKKYYFPCVVKPSIGSGSRGVFYAKNITKFKELINKNKIFYNYKKILIEEYIKGTEYAVEGWVNNNGQIIIAAISKKRRSKLPYLYDESLIINFKNNKIKKLISFFLNNFFSKINIKNQPFHMEFKILKSQVYLMDLSLRGAGFSVYSSIVSKIINQNTDKIIIDLFFKKKIKVQKSSKKIFYMKFFYEKNREKINKNFNKIKSIRTFTKINFYKNISTNRIGHILLECKKYDILKKEIIKLNKLL